MRWKKNEFGSLNISLINENNNLVTLFFDKLKRKIFRIITIRTERIKLSFKIMKILGLYFIQFVCAYKVIPRNMDKHFQSARIPNSTIL